MESIDLDREWAVIERLLPPDWRELSRERFAIRRERGITNPAVLLRLLLMHVGAGLSLRSTVARATQQRLAVMSAVALMKRLRSAEPWLAALTSRLFARTRFGARVGRGPGTQRVLRVVDATTVLEPGGTETDWRVHYSVRLKDLGCDYFQITRETAGETFKRFPVRRGDILMGDRGYGHREGVAHVVQKGGDVIVRLNLVPGDELNANEILELYRLRWQIELVFKRLKSLLRLSELPKHTDSSSRAWLQGKLLVALLIERLTETAELFSPWGHDLHSPEPLA
jgi:Transposase DDE domain